MKNLSMIILLSIASSAVLAKAPTWEAILTSDDVKIEKFEESTPNGQHSLYNFSVRFTNLKTNKQTTQVLIKNYTQDWIESRTDYSYDDGFLHVKISGTDLKDKGNGHTEQIPFKLEKCFKLNAAMTSFSSAKCPAESADH